MDMDCLPSMVKALRVRSSSTTSSVSGICVSSPWLVYLKCSAASADTKVFHSVKCKSYLTIICSFWAAERFVVGTVDTLKVIY